MSVELATEQDFKAAKRIQREKAFRGSGHRKTMKKAKSISILDGVLARPFHSLENSFELILRTWIPPPARIIDATAGKRWMWRNLIQPNHTLDGNGSGYELFFTDIEPQVEEVRKISLSELGFAFQDAWFDGFVVDPPYRRNVQGTRYDIADFRGDSHFDLNEFFETLNRVADDLLKKDGRLIVKVGDARVDGIFEPWDMIATKTLHNFVLQDRVIRRPFYQRKGAPWKQKDRATLTHEHFLLYTKKAVIA